MGVFQFHYSTILGFWSHQAEYQLKNVPGESTRVATIGGEMQ